MSTHDSSTYHQRLQHQLAYWERLRQAQPLTADEDQREVEIFPLSGRGTVYSFTTVTAPPEPFEAFAPYPLALVKLDEGPMVMAQLTDLEGPAEIGMRVEVVVRKLRTDGEKGIIIYGHKFRPLVRPEAPEA
jgi:uncharacterized OB-fold protein